MVQAYGAEDWQKLSVNYAPTSLFHRGKGCAKCGNTGYKGRTGIHELLVATDDDQAADPGRRAWREMRKQAPRTRA